MIFDTRELERKDRGKWIDEEFTFDGAEIIVIITPSCSQSCLTNILSLFSNFHSLKRSLLVEIKWLFNALQRIALLIEKNFFQIRKIRLCRFVRFTRERNKKFDELKNTRSNNRERQEEIERDESRYNRKLYYCFARYHILKHYSSL